MMEGSQEINEYDEEEYEEGYEEGIPGEGIGEEGIGEEDYDIGGSEPKPLGGIYQLFDTVLNKPRSTKVSNLNKDELGDLGISIRDSMRIALLGKSFGHKKFANFFLNQAGIVSDSAMSKEGWFTELFVTSKRYAARSSSSEIKSLPQSSKGKWKMFSGKKTGSPIQQ